jgi:hypothetical protein
MTPEILTSRNRLIAGLLVLLVLVIVICYFLVSFLFRKPEQPKIGTHSPIDTLAYCQPEQTSLCVVAFSQVIDGAMQVNIQTPYTHYPEINLKITTNGQESTYECKPMDTLATGIECIGASQTPGEVLNFKIISRSTGTLLAEGNFAIIGIALFTPAGAATSTETPTETVTPTETLLVTDTPLAPRFNTPTPTGTRVPPSYPNPTSYP